MHVALPMQLGKHLRPLSVRLATRLNGGSPLPKSDIRRALEI